jgi:iron complex outermembrane receptor protein
LTEYEEKVTIPGINMLLLNSLYNLRMKAHINDRLTVVSGVQGMFQRNLNFSNAEEVLLPSSLTLDNGLYGLIYLEAGKWNIQGGIRGDHRMIRSLETFNDKGPLVRNFGSVNFSLGAVRSVEKNTFRANVSSGFRAPHLSELLANGFHHGALRYEIGNTDLKNERATQLDLTYEVHGHHVELIVNPFANYIQRYISIQQTDSVIDGLPVFEYVQLPYVLMMGSDLGVHYHPHFAHWLHLESSVSFLHAADDKGRGPALMPQNRLNTLVKFSIRSKGVFSFEEIVLQHIYMAPQNRVAIGETMSPHYNLVHGAIKMKWGKEHPLLIDLGVKNIFNESYIDHLSRLKNIDMQSPGRNYYISVKYTITQSIRSNK